MTKNTVTTRPPAEVFKLWIKALRSGKYRQTAGKLRRQRTSNTGTAPGFCCLCDLAAKDGGRSWEQLGSAAYLPCAMADGLGLLQPATATNAWMHHLAILNDKRGYSFEQIAGVIEREVMPAALKAIAARSAS